MGICDFPERIFHLISGASERFRVAGFEGDRGRGIFVADVFVLFLEMECHNVTNEVKPNECVAE